MRQNHPDPFALGSLRSHPRLDPCSVRDGPLVDLGVQLEDRAGGPAAWKREDPEVLRAEQARRAQAAAEAAENRRAARLAKLRRDLERYEGLAALPHVEAVLADRYRFAASGEPTEDAGGAPLDDKALAKARKDVAKLQKVGDGVWGGGGGGRGRG